MGAGPACSTPIPASAARIEHVEQTRLTFPLATPFRAAIRLIASVDILLMRVHTQHAMGVGYAFAFGARDLAPIAVATEGLAEVLIGKDPVQTERHWAAMHHALALVGAGGPTLAALSALDIALWDLTGQTAGLSLAVLLGSSRDSVPVYGSGGSLELDTAQLIEEAQRFAALGYPAFKFKAGHGVGQDCERLGALRQALGPRFKLIVDANQQWSVKQALQAARAFEPHGVWWLEEPVPAQDIEACARVRAAAPIDIATGETNFGVPDFARLLGHGAADILMPNLQRVGGITGWRKVAAFAELHGIPVASHVYPEIGVHLLCAAPNGLTLEVLPWWPKLFVEPLAIDGGQARPPPAPGIGLTLDDAVLAAHRCR